MSKKPTTSDIIKRMDMAVLSARTCAAGMSDNYLIYEMDEVQRAWEQARERLVRKTPTRKAEAVA